MTRRSRRQVLAGAGTALATALAGCGGLDGVRSGGGDGTTYDRAAVVDLAERTPPTPPTGFPVSIPASAFERHRSRTAALLDEVPESPALPNEALATELANRRASVEDRFRGVTGEGREQSRDGEARFRLGDPSPRERLGRLRGIRADAAAVYAAHLAAIGRADRRAFRSLGESLRSAALDFRRSWRHAGSGPLEALVVHRHVEDLMERVAVSLPRASAFPENPRDDIFGVGEIAATLEGARAALVDADAIKQTYRESVEEPTPYRTALEAAAERLVETYDVNSAHADIREYLDLEEPPFDRSVRGTPAGDLYRRARWHVGRDFVRHGRLERTPASRCLQAAVGLAGVETFGTVVAAIDDGDYGVPESTAPVADAYGDAVDALRMVWRDEPRRLGRELDWPATGAFTDSVRALRRLVDERDDREVSGREISEVYGGLAYAYHFATYVPPAAAHLRDVLGDR